MIHLTELIMYELLRPFMSLVVFRVLVKNSPLYDILLNELFDEII